MSWQHCMHGQMKLQIPKKKWSIIYKSVINSFAKLDYCRKFFSLLRIFNVYVHGMRIDVICYKLNTLSLNLFKFFFQQLHWFLQLWSCPIKWYEKGRSIKLCMHYVVAKCFHIFSETATPTQHYKSGLQSRCIPLWKKNTVAVTSYRSIYQNSFAFDTHVTHQYYKIITSSWIPPWPESLQPSVIQITIAGST